LQDAQRINGTLRLFDIITGDNDALVGKINTGFDAELTRLNVRHGYTVMPGTHSMFVCGQRSLPSSKRCSNPEPIRASHGDQPANCSRDRRRAAGRVVWFGGGYR
jgi:hypothetical protein